MILGGGRRSFPGAFAWFPSDAYQLRSGLRRKLATGLSVGLMVFVAPAMGSVPKGLTVAAVGDLIIGQPEAADSAPGYRGVMKLIRNADVSFGNLEDSLIDPAGQHIWVAPEIGGAALSAPPSVARNIKDMGFDLLARANNHATDWGIRGMQATDKVLDRTGLVHAGTGPNLAAARAPAYLTTKWGRVALVAMTSTFRPMEPAGAPFRGVPGRPGVSALHVTGYHVVTPQQMAWLRQIYNSKPRKPARLAKDTTRRLYLFGTHYRVGKTDGLTYRMRPRDLKPILRSVRQGKEASNFEMVYIHAHTPGNWSEKSASFMQKLAHDAIDSGADEFVASGPHRLRGIEIYKGKPIFYSLGNFFFENRQQRFISPDQMKSFRAHAASTTTSEYYEHVLKHLSLNAPIWYQSVIAISVFDQQGTVEEVRLYPVDLGYDRAPVAERGVPHLASHKVAEAVLHRLQRLSRPYDTRIEIHGDIGVIKAGKR